MDEIALLEWKEAHADVYSKFKQDLEEQLLKPYHQTILDLGDGNAESLQSIIANLYAVSSKDGFDIESYIKRLSSLVMCLHIACVAIFNLTMVQTAWLMLLRIKQRKTTHKKS